ncbi:TetR/AcrR family transcriptional regulator [Tenacibaculum aiptasiae]|uniref:TetR/AcrR family transcriptional regulator n=1 Tax=Tenacibaculum aiptasiae TaxID=426481 RepID=UPI003B5C315B
MKLKIKILSKSIELFNRDGVTNVSPNKIAEILKISVGNLTYHFKTKESILEAILKQMIIDSSDYFEIGEEPTVKDYEKFRLKFIDFQNSYKFFFNDMVFIANKYPKIGDGFKKLTIERFKDGRKLIDLFINVGILKKESEYVNYNLLMHSIWLVTTFWITQERTIGFDVKGLDNSSKDVVWSMIYPYLTEKGRKQLEKI